MEQELTWRQREQSRGLFLRSLNWLVGVFFVLAMLFVSLLPTTGAPWLLLLVATASLGMGHLIGFLYGGTQDERERFSDVSTLVNGLLGGAAITDLAQANSNSLILRAARSVALACGLPSAGALLPIVATFGSLGFIHAYFHKRLLLNLLQKVQERIIDDLKGARNVVDGAEVTGDPGQVPQVTPQVRIAAAAIAADPGAGKDDTLERLRADGKALFLAHEFERAVAALRKARSLAPNDHQVLMTLAQVLLADGREAAAREPLETLTSLPGAPAEAWKLLGYAYLFTGQLDESEKATRKYLATNPKDGGALLNLACVHGQRGPDAPNAHEKLMPLLDELLALDKGWRARLRELTLGNEDFSKWVKDPEFQKRLAEEA
jgi:tetratricopeptide (TPR) repeat protein